MPGHELDVARIRCEIVDEQRLLAGDRGADETLTELQAQRFVVVRIADRVGHPQLAAPLVEQVDGERLERDQPADEDGNLREQLVEIEDRRDLAAQIEQRRDHLVLDGGRRAVQHRRLQTAARASEISETSPGKVFLTVGPRLLVPSDTGRRIGSAR